MGREVEMARRVLVVCLSVIWRCLQFLENFCAFASLATTEVLVLLYTKIITRVIPMKMGGYKSR